VLDLHRNWFGGIENKTADIFAALPFTPNQYTSLSIVAALAMLCLIAAGHYIAALALFIVAAGLDFIDGAVARKRGLATKRGAYWDTIADRYVEAMFLFGLLFCGLPDFYLSAAAWIFLALFGSTMTTYAKAAAKEKGLCDAELKGGLMSRGERLMVYFAIIILLSANLDWAVAILAALAILSNFTALQRIYDALKSG
jgi:phosphatidylglycerophosphate synthase